MRTVVLAVLISGCSSDSDKSSPLLVTEFSGAEGISLLGDSLIPPALPDSTRLQYEERWTEARRVVDSIPGDADAIIWLGRRTAYLGRYREAIDVFTSGIRLHPDDARMYRHRGHRYITLRRFDEAIADFNRAVQLVSGRQDETEPDGLPNARNIPTSTLQFNVWYHLGLAQYLKAEFSAAEESFRQTLEVSKNADAQVATRHWLYMTLRRQQKDSAAAAVLDPISAEMDVIENQGYHRLLLLYKGVMPVDSLVPAGAPAGVQDATVLYGVGNWHLYNRRATQATDIFRRVMESNAWAAFGYIAAEAELARQGPG